MRSWSIPAGRIFGTEIRIHLTYLALLAFVWMSESTMKSGATPVPSPMRGAYGAQSQDIVEAVLAALRDGDVVLVKGSLGSKMAVVVDALKARSA